MKVTYNDGKVSFDIISVLEQLTSDEMSSLVESLACQEQVLCHVAEQIASGYTDNGFSGSRYCASASDECSGTALDNAIRRVAKASSEVARKEIERLESALRHAEAARDRCREELQELISKTGRAP